MTKINSFLLVIFMLVGSNSFAELPYPTGDVNSSSRSATNTDQYRHDIDNFVNDQLDIVYDAISTVNESYRLGNYTTATMKAVSALNQMKYKAGSYFANTLTVKTIKRGLRLHKIMVNKIQKDRRGPKTTAFFMGEYLYFVKNVLDNYEMNSNDLGGFYFFGPREAEKNAIRYTVTLLQMLQRGFYTESNRSGKPYVYALGSENGVLFASALFLDAAANDLEDSIYAYRYSCFINELFRIKNKVWRHGGYRTAILKTYFDLADLIDPHSNVCYENPVRGDYDYRNVHTSTYVINRDYYINSLRGSTYMPLDRRGYVKKIVLDSIGIRNEAMYEVVVNNEVKGTIFVPGRDPRYVVTIEEETDLIEFRPLWGKAKITKVRVVEREPVSYNPY